MAKNLTNQNLHRAKKISNDEFYTQLADIENELKHYKEHFRGKIVYCNCDDPYESNFFQYFARNFHYLGLKKLITTGYATSPIAGTQLVLFDEENNPQYRKAHKIEITEIEDLSIFDHQQRLPLNELIQRNKGIKITNLNDEKDWTSGDFRSKQSIKCLLEADIVVTNPPFSLFREYITQLVQYNKKFLIIGNITAVTYKEIFPLIKSNKLWLGYNCTRHFMKPDGSVFETARTFWYTNLDIAKRHEFFVLYRHYDEKTYPKYDNYDAIEVGRAVDIPMDYDGVMGVPPTFLDKYNPEQFELIGQMVSTTIDEFNFGYPYINKKKKFARVLIRKRKEV